MKVDIDQFMDQGFLVLRDVIPPDTLDATRARYEELLDKQKLIWARERGADAPIGGLWETSPQPRLNLYSPGLLDETTGDVVDTWLHENTFGVAAQLLPAEEGMAGMMMMCSGVVDSGPSNWHRDVHPADMGPLRILVDDVAENGPRYVQWNIPLYDDNVLWAVPGSHRRLNTPDEGRELAADSRVALGGGVQIDLMAGDGVVYNNFLIHWGSNYTRKMRRTIHGGHAIFTHYDNLDFTRYLSASARDSFEKFDRRSKVLQNHTESALRAAIARDASAFQSALASIQPGAGDKGKLALTIHLGKAVHIMNIQKRKDFQAPVGLERSISSSHPITLNWGPEFADRFSVAEATILWERFKWLDFRLRGDRDVHMSGFQGGPTTYIFNEPPADVTIDNVIASWNDNA